MKADAEQTTAKIEIDLDTLCRLLKNHQMCVAEIRCLDRQSKHLVWKTCLRTCLAQTAGQDVR